MPHVTIASHDCPRCGYDLAGTLTTWNESCPVSGRCSECGLDFFWGDVLNPALRAPRWSCEHSAARVVSLAGARPAIGTVVRVFCPWRFWSRMRMQLPFRPWRIVRLVLAWCLVLMAFHAAAVYAWNQLVYSTIWPGGSARNADPAQSLFRALCPRSLVGTDDLFELAVLPISSLHPPVVTYWLLLTSTLVPLCFVLLPQTLRTARVRPRHLVRIWLYGLPVSFTLTTLPWIGDDALSALSHLRWKLNSLSGIDVYQLHSDWATIRWRILALLWMLWHTAWWWAACGCYLVLPRARWVAPVLVLLAMLLAALPFVFTPALSTTWIIDLWRRNGRI